MSPHRADKIETVEFNSPAFGSSDGTVESMREYVRLESESLNRSEQSVRGGDRKSDYLVSSQN